MAVNKVVKSDGTSIIDITPTTAVESDVTAGKVFFGADGEQKTGGRQSGGTAAISVVDTEDSHGGTIRTITALDISDTTAVDTDVAQGKYFYTAQGVKTPGAASGGGTPSQTQHTIYFEFTDETSATITAYYDSSFIGDAIRTTTPTTYGSKTVTLAQLDGVTWYEASNIPLNTELVDYNAVRVGYYVDDDGTITEGESWECVTDYISIDPSMTFTFVSKAWYGIGFYDASKTRISGYVANDIGTLSDEVVQGTITPSLIPSNAAYIVLTGNPYSLTPNNLSLIRTA